MVGGLTCRVGAPGGHPDPQVQQSPHSCHGNATESCLAAPQSLEAPLISDESVAQRSCRGRGRAGGAARGHSGFRLQDLPTFLGCGRGGGHPGNLNPTTKEGERGSDPDGL